MLKLKTYNTLESKHSLIKEGIIFTVSSETFHQDAFKFHNKKKNRAPFGSIQRHCVEFS